MRWRLFVDFKSKEDLLCFVDSLKAQTFAPEDVDEFNPPAGIARGVRVYAADAIDKSKVPGSRQFVMSCSPRPTKELVR